LAALLGTTDKIDENFFSTSEQGVLKQAAINAFKRSGSDKTNLSYEDYPDNAGVKWAKIAFSKEGGGILNILKKSIDDPAFSALTTVGGATLNKDKEGNIILTDKYNFNHAYSSNLSKGENPDHASIISAIKIAIEQSPYAGLKQLGNAIVPRKNGLDIKLNLGKP
jgi:hypothetical protein